MRYDLYDMVENKIRIVLDTNWYISATINKKSRRILYKILAHPGITVLFSEEIVNEYRNVIVRDKFKKTISIGQAIRFLNLILPTLEYVTIKTFVEQSRDVNDNYLLSLSIDGKADYLVTGDMDLLILEKIGQTKILKLNSFIESIYNPL